MNPALVFGWLPVVGVTGRDIPVITMYALLVVFFGVAVLVGWTRLRRPWLQMGFALVICGLYGTYLIGVGIWAAQCWDCTDGAGEDSRGMGYGIGMVWLGFWAVLNLAGLGIGTLLSHFVRRQPAQANA